MVCLLSIRGQARKARIEKFELDEGLQPYHPPFRSPPRAESKRRASVCSVKDHPHLPNYSPLSVGQVVLEKWFPLITAESGVQAAGVRAEPAHQGPPLGVAEPWVAILV